MMYEKLLDKIDNKYHKTHDPKGWVIGRAIAHHLSNYYSHLSTKQDWKYHPVKNELYGLPFIIDTNDQERLEIIS